MTSLPSMKALTRGNSRRRDDDGAGEEAHEAEAGAVDFFEGFLYLMRRAMTSVRSTSLKVVRMAAVCWASTRRRAMECAFWSWGSGACRRRRRSWPAVGAGAAGMRGRVSVGAAGGLGGGCFAPEVRGAAGFGLGGALFNVFHDIFLGQSTAEAGGGNF